MDALEGERLMVYYVRMYPNQLDGTRNELSLTADDPNQALIKGMDYFRAEDWRRQGTYFEVRSDDPGEVLLRGHIST